MLVTIKNDIEEDMEWEEVRHLPTKIGSRNFYNIICFTFDNDNGYYEKDYVKRCMESWKIRFPFSRFIFINVDEVKKYSKWSLVTYQRKNFPTDSLRLLFTSQLNNALYIDTDVFIRADADLPLDLPDFVYENCSGTMLWNKFANNKRMMLWFVWYEKVAKDIAEGRANIDDYCDCNAWAIYGKNLIPSFRTNRNFVNHFSGIWPFMRDKQILTLDSKGETVACFCNDSWWAFMSYCIERGYTDKVTMHSDKAVGTIIFHNT